MRPESGRRERDERPGEERKHDKADDSPPAGAKPAPPAPSSRVRFLGSHMRAPAASQARAPAPGVNITRVDGPPSIAWPARSRFNRGAERTTTGAPHAGLHPSDFNDTPRGRPLSFPLARHWRIDLRRSCDGPGGPSRAGVYWWGRRNRCRYAVKRRHGDENKLYH